MQKEWSSFRITLILYLVVLILPFSFYFVYTSFQTMQTDTRVVRQSSWTAGAMEHLALKQNDQTTVVRIDKALQEISPWIAQNNDSKLYIGSQTLSKDFSQINACWTAYKESYLKHDNTAIKQHSLQCYELTDTMAIIIEKMVYLKQNKIINVFYLSLALAMILVLLMIYLVRTYIHTQMKKHAIHDHDTKLFNKKYYMAELKTTCSRSARHDYPLSILCVSIDNFEKENKTYTARTKRNTLKVFGILIDSLVRDGDIACRYDENHFFVLLPFTGQENALILEERIRQALEKDNWMRSNKIVFKFKITEFDKKESEEAFIARTLDQSQLR
ncbi:MAG: diguanylate cyclase [Sulfurovum sp.]|uniref:GGDEF domain-containing protein n=1 Tax=Sulfurovum sp. TaxID=1969726 RepID=UPI00286824C6|nr:diguanylate cyclase [Sulfurovum sp.]MCO4845972.1 diguanylate cyclase [Sulfurovum sp.]